MAQGEENELQSYADALVILAEKLLNRALESRKEATSASSESRQFQSGRNMAYFEVLDIFGGVADLLEIDRAVLGLPEDALNTIIASTD